MILTFYILVVSASWFSTHFSAIRRLGCCISIRYSAICSWRWSVWMFSLPAKCHKWASFKRPTSGSTSSMSGSSQGESHQKLFDHNGQHFFGGLNWHRTAWYQRDFHSFPSVQQPSLLTSMPPCLRRFILLCLRRSFFGLRGIETKVPGANHKNQTWLWSILPSPKFGGNLYSSCSKNIPHFDSEHGFHFLKFPPLPSDKNSRPQRRRLSARNVWLARRGAVLPPGIDTEPKLDHFTRGKKNVQKENSKKRPKNKSSDIYNWNPTTSQLYDPFSYHNYQWYEHTEFQSLALSTVKTTSGTFGGGDFAPEKFTSKPVGFIDESLDSAQVDPPSWPKGLGWPPGGALSESAVFLSEQRNTRHPKKPKDHTGNHKRRIWLWFAFR